MSAPINITDAKKKTILDMATKYNFYVNEIEEKLYCPLRVAPTDGFVDKDCGFIIWEDITTPIVNSNTCIIAFAFVLPNMRRNGIMTMFLNKLKEQFDTICYTTKNPVMVAFGKKYNFTHYGTTFTGDEECYCWSNKLTNDKIRTTYYPNIKPPPPKKKRKGKRGGKKKRGGRNRRKTTTSSTL